jgi:short subunit dehydrogenase-like uncharacterized protein
MAGDAGATRADDTTLCSAVSACGKAMPCARPPSGIAAGLQACVEHGTHYCDLTGEPQFIRRTIEAHHSVALGNSTKIIHCCGFDSVPSEVTALLSADYLKKKYGLNVDRSETILLDGAHLSSPAATHAFAQVLVLTCAAISKPWPARIRDNRCHHAARGGVSGGTIESGIGLMKEPKEVRKQVNHPYAFDPENWSKPLDQMPDRTDMQILPMKLKNAHAWSGPFIMAAVNGPVVRRSNHLLGYGAFAAQAVAGSFSQATLLTSA